MDQILDMQQAEAGTTRRKELRLSSPPHSFGEDLPCKSMMATTPHNPAETRASPICMRPTHDCHSRTKSVRKLNLSDTRTTNWRLSDEFLPDSLNNLTMEPKASGPFGQRGSHSRVVRLGPRTVLSGETYCRLGCLLIIYWLAATTCSIECDFHQDQTILQGNNSHPPASHHQNDEWVQPSVHQTEVAGLTSHVDDQPVVVDVSVSGARQAVDGALAEQTNARLSSIIGWPTLNLFASQEARNKSEPSRRKIKLGEDESAPKNDNKKSDRLGNEFVSSSDYDFGFDVNNNNNSASMDNNNNNEHNQPSSTNELTEQSEPPNRDKQPYDLPLADRFTPNGLRQATSSHSAASVPPPSSSASLMAAPSRWSQQEEESNTLPDVEHHHATMDAGEDANVDRDDGQATSRQLLWNADHGVANRSGGQSAATIAHPPSSTMSSSGRRQNDAQSATADSSVGVKQQQQQVGERARSSGAARIISADLPLASPAKSPIVRRGAGDNKSGSSLSSTTKYSTLLSSSGATISSSPNSQSSGAVRESESKQVAGRTIDSSGTKTGQLRSASSASLAPKAPVHARPRLKLVTDRLVAPPNGDSSQLQQGREINRQEQADTPNDESNSLEIFSQQFKYTATKARKLAPTVAGFRSSLQSRAADKIVKLDQAKERRNVEGNPRSDVNEERHDSKSASMPTKLLPVSDDSGKRAARTLPANKTTSGVPAQRVASNHSADNPDEGARLIDAKQSVRYAVYDVTKEGSKTTEHKSNYSAELANLPPQNSLAKLINQPTNRTDSGTNSTSLTAPKTSTKRREAWDRLLASKGSPSMQHNPGVGRGPVLTLHLSSDVATKILNKIQPKQDISRLVNYQRIFQQPTDRRANASSYPINDIQRLQSFGGLDRSSIVRSGFVVPSNPLMPRMQTLQSLTPSTLAMMSQAHHSPAKLMGGTPLADAHQSKQSQVLNQLKAFLTNQQQAQMQHNTESLLPGSEYLTVGSPQNSPLIQPAETQQNLEHQHAPLDQMMVTANQLGVSHLGPHHPLANVDSLASVGGINSAASLQDYSLDLPPPPISPSASSQREARGGDNQGSLGGVMEPMQDGPSSGDQQHRADAGRGSPSSSNIEPEVAQQRQEHRSNLNANNYATDYNQSGMSSGPSTSQQDSNESGYNSAYYSDSGRNSSASHQSGSHAAADYYTSSPMTRSSSSYYSRPEHKSSDSMMPNSLRSSLDPFEDPSGSSLSTSEYERDLADLDEEFNRHAIFNRPMRPNGATYSSTGSGASLMSDSMLSYSPDRYENIRYHHHHHHHQPYPRRPQSLSHAYESLGYGLGATGNNQPAMHTSTQSASPVASGLPTSGDYLNAAGSISNIIPRPPFPHHYHNQRGSLWPAASSSAYSSALPNESEMWLPDAASYDYSPLASYLSPTSHQFVSGNKWPRPFRYNPHHHFQQPQATHPRSLSPYLALAPSGGYLSASASDQPTYSLMPSYASAATSVATAAAPNSGPTETVSFTISPLAAAAAAAATALAHADKARHHHHHNHGHSWTFTLPRLASTLAGQTSGQLASAGSGSSAHTPAVAASSPYPYATAASPYRPTAGSYLFSPVPIYAIATRPAASPIASAASAATPSVVPIHSYHPAAAAPTPTAGMIAYRPASFFASAPVFTSFAYPVRLPVAAAPAAYQSQHNHATSQDHHHLHHYSGGVRPLSSSLSAGRAVSSSASLKPFYADLQFAESKPKLNSNGQNGGSSSSSSKSIVKATAGGLTQIARNLTKKMFGSASQIRPQFAAPPANFEPIVSPPSTAGPSAGGASSSNPTPSLPAAGSIQQLTQASPQLLTSSSLAPH